MTDPGIFPRDGDNGEPDRLGVYDEFAASENRSADFVPDLVSLGFIKDGHTAQCAVFVRHGRGGAARRLRILREGSPLIPGLGVGAAYPQSLREQPDGARRQPGHCRDLSGG